MTTTTPTEDIATILEKAKPRSPQTCHTIDDRGYALCGAFRCSAGEDGQWDRSDLHSKSECRRRGHRSCVACEELSRQLADDRMVA